MVKNLPAIQETQVHSLGREDPLEEEMATHYSILAWRIPWTEEPDGLQSMRSQRDMTEQLTLSLSLFRVPNTAHRNNPKPLYFASVYSSPVSLNLLLSVARVSSSFYGGAMEWL